MTQDHSVNVKLSDVQLNKLNTVTKNVTKVTLRLSSNIFVTDETSFFPKFISN